MKSMTGFGVARGKVGRSQVFIETRSVNHRFCEVNVRSPGKLARLEGEIIRQVRQKFSRGKFDVFIREESMAREEQEVLLAKQSFHLLKKIQKELSLKGEITIADVLSVRSVYAASSPAEDIEPLQNELIKLLVQSLTGLEVMRVREGVKLQKWFLQKLSHLLKILKKIEKDSLQTGPKYKKRLHKKMKRIGADEQRIAQEVAVVSERSDVTEEIVRLRSHLEELGHILGLKDPIGRKLDFLAQEMGREINTIGSKSQGVKISHQVIDFKSELEKVREQIQNIE